MNKYKEEKGVISIEAILSLFLFIYAMVAILSLVNFIKVQGIIQNALNQTTIEISQYSYIYAKLGGVELEESLREKANKFIDKSDEGVQILIDLSESVIEEADKASDTITQFNPMDPASYDDIEALAGSKDGTIEEFENAVDKMGDLLSDPSGLLKGLSSVAMSEGLSALKSKVVAPALGKLLISKYINMDDDNADKTLERLRVVNGLDGLDFGMSTLLDDGQSINMSVAYTVKSIVPSFIMRDQTYIQTASTAAWLGQPLKFAEGKTLWNLPSFPRGQQIVQSLRASRSNTAVSTGQKFDFYDSNRNEFILTKSLNPALPSYIDNDSKVKQVMRSAANDLKNVTKKIKEVQMMNNIVMPVVEDDTKTLIVEIVIPKNADKVRLENLARELEQENPDVKYWINADFGNYEPID